MFTSILAELFIDLFGLNLKTSLVIILKLILYFSAHYRNKFTSFIWKETTSVSKSQLKNVM